MIGLTKGTKENLVVDVTDRLNGLTTLDGTSASFDIRWKNADTWIIQGDPVTNIGMRAYCLVDTAPSEWKVGTYELFINFDALPEEPRIGPLEFEVAHGTSADLPDEFDPDPAPIISSPPLLLQTQVTLTDAQIRALPTTPFQLVEAPGAGNLILLKDVLLHKDFAADYTNGDSLSAYITAVLGNDDLESLELHKNAFTNRLASFLIAGEFFYWYRYQTPYTTDAPYQSAEPFGVNCINAPAFLYVENQGAGDFIGGDPTNTLKVTTFYVVVEDA